MNAPYDIGFMHKACHDLPAEHCYKIISNIFKLTDNAVSPGREKQTVNVFSKSGCNNMTG